MTVAAAAAAAATAATTTVAAAVAVEARSTPTWEAISHLFYFWR